MAAYKENGNITVVALLILVILTLIGISVSRTSDTDIIAARNLIPHKQDFYAAEGMQNIEAIKVGRGDYHVLDIDPPGLILADSTEEITPGNSCDYMVTYKGRYPPPKGYSILYFSRYDYEIQTQSGKSSSNKVKINARYYSIGTRMK